MSNLQAARALGWTSIAVGVTEIAATRWLESEMGVDNHHTLLRAFGAREIAAGVTILAQPGLNRTLAGGLWARVIGGAIDLAALGLAAKRTRKPHGLSAIAALVLGVTAADIVVASRIQHDLCAAKSASTAARRRVRPSKAMPNGAAAAEPQVQGYLPAIPRD